MMWLLAVAPVTGPPAHPRAVPMMPTVHADETPTVIRAFGAPRRLLLNFWLIPAMHLRAVKPTNGNSLATPQLTGRHRANQTPNLPGHVGRQPM